MEILNFKSGFASFRENWKQDLQSGFSISLIALPLCLGIAIASGFPPIAGLFAAIVGGLLVSRINGSHITITGPAAGLIVVNLGAIETLGQGDNAAGYKYALAAIVVAGVMIFLLGLFKAGKFGDFFPTAAVHGMLAAIGVIIIVKQLFVALGVSAHGHELYEVMAEIPEALLKSNPEVALIAVVSLIILIVYPKIKIKAIKLIPAPMWVLLVAIPLELVMDWQHEHELVFLSEHFKVGPQLLVHLPERVLDGVVMPDFAKIGTSAFWIAATTIALVTAIESLLSAVAVDSLDPFKRKSNLNKDVSAMGIGASVSGFIGGLPMISEIVRSSANVSDGAKSQWSNFFHAIFLLVFMFALQPVIELIPMSALAAMLIFTGYRLASPKEFKHVKEIGSNELIVFISTLVMVLATDLLIGIAVGIMVNMVLNIVKGASLSNLFKLNASYQTEGNTLTIAINGVLVFSNYLGLKSVISKHSDKNIILDLSKASYVDHTALHHIKDLMADKKLLGKSLTLANTSLLKASTEHPLSEISLKGKHNLNEILSDALPIESVEKELKGFELFKGKTIVKCTGENNEGVVRVSVKDLGTLSNSTDEISLSIIDFKRDLPVFEIHKEHAVDRALETIGVQDIDFNGFDDFSSEYIITGHNETLVRTFFTNEVINVFNKHGDYLMESNGSKILLYTYSLNKNDNELFSLKDELIDIV